MALDPSQLPDDVTTLKALLIAAERRAANAEKNAADAEKKERDLAAEIETLKLTIAKLQHERFGPSSERARLLDQLELQLGELVAHVTQTETAAEIAAAQPVQAEQTPRSAPPRRQPARRRFPPICRASAVSSPRPLRARAAAAPCASSARTSPRRWSACRRSGR